MATLRRCDFSSAMALFLFCVAISQPVARPAIAQKGDKAALETAGSAWQVRCADAGAGLRCRAVQTIILRKTRKRLLSVRVSRPAGGEAALIVTLPHGLFLPAGISWRIDEGEEGRLTVQTCNVGGCYAGMPLGDKQLGALKRGGKLIISFQDLNKKQVQVAVSLRGFTDAVARI